MNRRKSKPTLTEVLKAAIEQSGLTDYRISEATGIHASSLSRFMRGHTSLMLDKADRLAAYLGLRLVADPDAKPPEPTPENRARPKLTARKVRKTNQ